MSSNLITHVKGTVPDVTREQLAQLPKPERKGNRHVPIPHIEFVQTVELVAASHGVEVVREEFALQRSGAWLFGVMDMRLRDVPGDLAAAIAENPDLAVFRGVDLPGREFSVGLRAGNDKNLGIHVVAGGRVTVCDNLMLAGEMIAMEKMHSFGLHLETELRGAFRRMGHQLETFNARVEHLRQNELTAPQARDLIYRLFAEGVLPPTFFPRVHEAYFQVEGPDCAPRSEYGLLQALTRVFRELPNTAERVEKTTAVAKFLGL